MKVPTKFRYPLFKELHWYVLERYISCVMGKEHRVCSEDELRAINGDVDEADTSRVTPGTISSSHR